MSADLQNIELLDQLPLPWQATQWQQLLRQLESKQLAHAYLVSGESGLGKKLFVYGFAKLLLCQNPAGQVPCGECKSCVLEQQGSNPDLINIGVEAGSKEIKIDQIRGLMNFVGLTSHAGGMKVAIINDAHLMNSNSANAILKTLEEPSSNTFLFLVSNLPGRLKATIRSRCQRLAIAPPPSALARDWLQGKIDKDKLDALLEAAGNSPLRALQLDQQGLIESRQAYLQGLTAVSRQASAIASLAKLSKEISEIAAIEHLYWVSSIVIKQLLLNSSGPDGVNPIGRLSDAFSVYATDPGQNTAMATKLLSFQEEVIRARNLLMSGANPNPQLLMESLLWHWHMLFKSS